jgi:hypothetical protein
VFSNWFNDLLQYMVVLHLAVIEHNQLGVSKFTCA